MILSAAALLAGAMLWFSHEEGTRGEPSASGELPALGLMTTLPIYWNEAASIDEMLGDDAQQHWARTALEQEFRLLPLDTLSDQGGLDGVGFLLLAQPRALSPEENVALDEWVRAGGKLLLLADPLLTGESRFHIGDRRRPQDVALLSPILARWGLELEFDEAQDGAERIVTDGEITFPVRLAGSWRASTGECNVAAVTVIARCTIGSGQVLAIADAAILELDHHESDNSDALGQLVRLAFDSP
ncbi:ABC transporter [Altererythrobacter sp. MF3-039]|uniref:Gldg family protein n=1 Tax=Altererythrobacter sp. MF3-039 TaxID=3252901 RepID=UPI00390C9E80